MSLSEDHWMASLLSVLCDAPSEDGAGLPKRVSSARLWWQTVALKCECRRESELNVILEYVANPSTEGAEV